MSHLKLLEGNDDFFSKKRNESVILTILALSSSVLQPNSPQAMVKTALQSANKTRLVSLIIRLSISRWPYCLDNTTQLARRLYYSFIKPGQEFLTLESFFPYFKTQAEAEVAFTLFDRDSNGDVSRDEMEMTCLCVILR
jgi:hypothetical protein